jgi:hypothetical protein
MRILVISLEKNLGLITKENWIITPVVYTLRSVNPDVVKAHSIKDPEIGELYIKALIGNGYTCTLLRDEIIAYKKGFENFKEIGYYRRKVIDNEYMDWDDSISKPVFYEN